MTNPMGAGRRGPLHRPRRLTGRRTGGGRARAFGAIVSRAASAGAHDGSMTDSVKSCARGSENRSKRSLQKLVG